MQHESMQGLLRPWVAASLPLAAFLAATVLWSILPAATLETLFGEGGWIERPTEWLYFAAALAIIFWRPRGAHWADAAALAVVLAAFGAREMDLHKDLAGTSILRLSYYFGDAPAQSKLLAAAAVLVTLLAIAWSAARHARSVLRGLRVADPVSVSCAVFIGTLVLTKLLDRSVGVLREDFGVAIAPAVATLVVALEEAGELALPALALLALWQHQRLAARRATR